MRDPSRVQRNLDAIAGAGYHGIRYWTVLGGSYWAGREVDAGQQRDSAMRFAEELIARGLAAVVSQGDGMKFGNRQALKDINRHLPAAFRDAGNETWQNGETNPQRLAEFITGLSGVKTLSSPPGEEQDELDDFSVHPAECYDVHGYRGGRWWDKVRHIFSLAYEIKPRHRLGIQSEPFGPGPFVSVTDNKHELDGDVMATAAVMSAIARQAWVYFPGFEKDTGALEQPGFRETPKAMAHLPKDLMRFQHLVHGGSSQSRRVFAVTDEGGAETMRCDHAIHDDGRYVCLAYGPNLSAHRQVKGTVEQTVRFGQKAVLYIGRV